MKRYQGIAVGVKTNTNFLTPFFSFLLEVFPLKGKNSDDLCFLTLKYILRCEPIDREKTTFPPLILLLIINLNDLSLILDV